MNCWKCGSLLDDFEGKLAFRAICTQCGFSLHCCKNCKNYAPGRSNDCLVPGTEFVSDRAANNFCEEFLILGKAPATLKTHSKHKFDDLFKT